MDYRLTLFYLFSKILQSHDATQVRWVGPVPGDIAEVEAYCRIFRAAERLYIALMDTLCNPLTGECSVSYDLPSEDKPLLEDKIVSVLGCVVSLLNKAREDVLSGRSSLMNSFRDADVSAMEDKLPPLALFRSEMKRCCESLHVALEDYLTPDDNRSLNVWRKLQRLKNVCYDSGFTRGDDYPSHTVFANWKPVYLSTSKEDIPSKDSEVAFWGGGQVTEEGLKWLIEKGFKTIVDLRAETVKDNFYQALLDDVTLSGKVELVKIPVEVGTAPSMEQVEKFASLVSDSRKNPIYLHSKEGVWRVSAMVSRWRQYMTRCASQSFHNQSVRHDDTLSQNTIEAVELDISSKTKDISPQDENNSPHDSLEKTHSSSDEEVSLAKGDGNQGNNGAYNGHVSGQHITSAEIINNELRSLTNFDVDVNPLKAQFPPCNVFSRDEMSNYLKSKKVSPPTYVNYQRKRVETLPVSRETYIRMTKSSENVHPGPESRFLESESSNRSLSVKNLSPESQRPSASNGSYPVGVKYDSSAPSVNGFGIGAKTSVTVTNASSIVGNSLETNGVSTVIREDQIRSGEASSSGDDGLGQIEGNMCASATGVVRVQSRKKAEMFLVRTDGFSCTREKVTESSLAFTHPSTQQQMLMWKSTPKTVLLLKKLGQELMEEAKEVSGLLYLT